MYSLGIFLHQEEIEKALDSFDLLLETTDQPWIYTPPHIPLASRKTDPQELQETLFRLTGMSIVTKDNSDTRSTSTLPADVNSDTFFFDEFDETETSKSTLSNQNGDSTENRETFNFLLDEEENKEEEKSKEIGDSLDELEN